MTLDKLLDALNKIKEICPGETETNIDNVHFIIAYIPSATSYMTHVVRNGSEKKLFVELREEKDEILSA